jgi:hypothetical protein
MRIPVEWACDTPEDIDLQIDDAFLEQLRNMAHLEATDASGYALNMADFHTACNGIHISGFVPNTVVTTFGMASELQELYAPFLSVRAIRYAGRLYNNLVFVSPVPFDMAIIPHRSVKSGKLFIFDRSHLDNPGAVRYIYNHADWRYTCPKDEKRNLSRR